MDAKVIRKDPLARLEFVVAAIVIVMGVFGAFLVLGVAAGSSSIPGLNAEVCATTGGADTEPGFRQVAGEQTGPIGLVDGITWRADRVQICDPEPDGATRALGAVGLTAWAVAPLVFFALLWRMLHQARREGVFADRIPASLRLLGGVLLVWAALDFLVTGIVNAALLNRMADNEGVVVFTQTDAPLLLILLGVTLLALERVMAQAVDMRHDVEATI